MKNRMGKITAVLLAGMMTAGTLTGCAQKITDYSTAVAATYGEQKIYLDEANFMARYDQWYNEYYYMGYFGDAIWSQDFNGKTMEAATKEDIMASILQTEVLVSHAEEYGVSLTEQDLEKVSQACTRFFEEMDEKMIEKSGATEELVRRVFEKNALANKVWQAVVADVDTNVSLEESQQIGIRYVLIRNDSEEVEDPEAAVNEIVSRVQGGEEITAAAESMGLYCGYNTYAKYGETEDALTSAAVALTEGEATVFRNEEVGWYALYCETECDEEATANKERSIINERKAALFREVYAGWEKAPFEVDEDVWGEVVFDRNPIYEAPASTAPENVEQQTTTTGVTEAQSVSEPGTEAAEQQTIAAE